MATATDYVSAATRPGLRSGERVAFRAPRSLRGERLHDESLEVRDQALRLRQQVASVEEAARDPALHALDEPRVLGADLVVEGE